MIGAEVEKVNLFGAIEREFLGRSHDGLLSMGKAVIQTAWDSMPVADGPAPSGEPPHSHTETLRNALAFAIEHDYLYVGTLFSEVGVRGAVLEFGGRRDPVMSRKRSRRTGKYKPHPFIGPALDKNLDTFAPRVAGGFTS